MTCVNTRKLVWHVRCQALTAVLTLVTGLCVLSGRARNDSGPCNSENNTKSKNNHWLNIGRVGTKYLPANSGKQPRVVPALVAKEGKSRALNCYWSRRCGDFQSYFRDFFKLTPGKSFIQRNYYKIEINSRFTRVAILIHISKNTCKSTQTCKFRILLIQV